MNDAKPSCRGFGLIIVGNEILDGRVADSHFANAREVLEARDLALLYAMILPDDPDVIEAQLRWAVSRPDPFFSCGGIGTTPDDHTRHCAARVAGVGVRLHPEGVAMLKRRFGAEATPPRLRLVEFPEGCTLIPNPVNQVPGFRLANGHFLPGFPNMATSMMAWVADTWYGRGAARLSRAFVLPGAREADLVELMEAFVAAHAGVSFSSLPRFTASGTEVQLGLSGPPDLVLEAELDLRRALEGQAIRYEPAG